MNKDVIFTEEFEITMFKVLWSDNEIAFAKCLSFDVDIEHSIIICNLMVTNKISIIEFIKESFSRMWNHPSETQFKEALIQNIDSAYERMYSAFVSQYSSKLDYWEQMFVHQKDSLFMSINKQKNFYALEQGLGKTLVAASKSKMLNIRRTLIACPASLKHNWLKDLCNPKGVSKFNEMYFSLLDASKSHTIRAFQERFVICNFDSIAKHLKHILSDPIGHIIIDEATAIKNINTDRYKQLNKVIEANPEAHISLLSGTPVRNRINDLFAYLKITGHPLGENYSYFLKEYTLSSKGRVGDKLKITGAKNTELLWRQTSNFMIRKKKIDCLDLPDKIYGRLHFELNDFQTEYDKAVREALESSGKTNLNTSIHSINIVTSKAKLNGVIAFAESIIEQGEKVVIYSGYTSIVEALRDHFGDRCVMINGSVASHTRSIMVDRFMTDESCMVFIGNTLAAGTGLTLTVSSNMIFCDFPFSPSDLVQAEDRLHRIGQKNSVNIYYAMATESIDEHLYSLIAEKAHDASRVIDNHGMVMDSDNLSEILISKLRDKYNIPVKEVGSEETK